MVLKGDFFYHCASTTFICPSMYQQHSQKYAMQCHCPNLEGNQVPWEVHDP